MKKSRKPNLESRFLCPRHARPAPISKIDLKYDPSPFMRILPDRALVDGVEQHCTMQPDELIYHLLSEIIRRAVVKNDSVLVSNAIEKCEKQELKEELLKAVQESKIELSSVKENKMV